MKEKGFVLPKAEGFTLLELLLAMLVSGVVMSAALSVVYHIARDTPRNNGQIEALVDARQAALAIKNDMMVARTTSLNGTPASSANLSWTDYSSFESVNNTSHAAIYTLTGTELRRTYDGTVGIVGRKVSSISFTQNGQLVTVVITSTGGGIPPQTATVSFSSHLRPEELE